MPYSVVRDGKVLDITYRKRSNGDTLIWLGENVIGQIFKVRNYYSVIVNGPIPIDCIKKVDGFKTRLHCAEYCLAAMEQYRLKRDGE